MLLRKFEAYGFKSFADRIEIDLGSGITAIVGPNGSGKSNIADAVRWALGEQSIRSLRGTKMEDVIFAGSVKRRALGVAEVSLTFDNSDGTLPIDFNEVIITRRVFRSGEGEYFINKSPCRLKDIHALLADTGLGRDAMAIIGQNKVDEILNSKPEERRLLFEEAAGITKYKQRKKEALRKLDDTEQNLTRVADIFTEIQSQLGPLAESAERTQKYNQLSLLLKSCQATILVTKLEKAVKMVETAKFGQADLAEQELALSTKLNKDEIEQERYTQSLAAYDEMLHKDEQLIVEASTEIERLDGQAGILKERVTQSKLAQERIAQEQQRVTAQATTIHNKIVILEASIAEKSSHKLEVDACLSSKNLQYEQTCAALDSMNSKLEKSRDRTFDHMQDIVSQRNEFRSNEKELANNRQQQARLQEELKAYQAQLAAAKANYQDLLAELNSSKDSAADIERQGIQAEQEKINYGQELKIKLASEKKVADEIQAIQAKCKALTAMQNEFEGFGRGIKHILKSSAPWRLGVCGAVAQIVSVPDAYVTAIEIALGGALQNIITDNEQIAQQAINFLKSQHLGRATFLPLSSIKPMRPKTLEEQAAHASGALGFAAKLVNCEPKYLPVVEYLLGRTIIAQDMDAAVRIAKKTGYSVKIVTLDGEVITPGGAMTGGSIHRKETSFLSRHNEIESMKAKLAALTEEQRILQSDVKGLEQQVQDIDTKIACLRAKQQELEVKQAQLSIHLEKSTSEQERFILAVNTSSEEISGKETERGRLQDKLELIKQKIVQLEAEDNEYKQKIVQWQEQLKAYSIAKEALSASLTQTKISLTSLESEITSQKNGLSELIKEKEVIQAQLAGIEREAIELTAKIQKAEAEIKEVRKSQTVKLTEKQQYEEERQKNYGKKLTLLASLQTLEKDIKENRRRLTAVQNRLHETGLLSAKYEYEVQHCLEGLAELALTAEQAQDIKVAGSNDELTARVTKLDREILALGTINPAAIEEYNKVSERYQFMQTQYQDLTEGKDYLLSIIKDIDETMSKQFNAAFITINKYFSEIFVRLFGGGKAFLQLLEPANVLETGIDIIVQPPGKKLQNLALLSGGERALTVIALLFALLEFRPAPFCVLDEIDAALDEANVNRFGEFLRDYGRNTQFVVVTHRKGTMEVANVMHGVTMEESGISKLLSVKFMDKAV